GVIMGCIESWGLYAILSLQSRGGPAADAFFRLITLLGDEKFFLLFLPLVFWCFDKRLGLRLAVLVLLSDTVNLWLKWACGLPRPPAPPVFRIAEETGPGFPSGHTQSVTVAFGYLASQLQRWRVHILAAVLVFLVALSRIYLGVHYPHDVLGGLVIGYLILLLFVRTGPLAERRWASWTRGLRYGVAVGVPLVLLALSPSPDAASDLGALAGFGVGATLEAQYVRFSAGGPALRRLLRLVLGAVVVVALYAGPKAVLPEGAAWSFVRYATVALAATAAVPWLFVRLGLAQPEGAPRLAGAA
ncbi:MAG: phosphatase PAP2 family protein, partial [Anaerolineae bacterium]|nr:phosphatase PAP2 family protein [Anaerolineae bacterium]